MMRKDSLWVGGLKGLVGSIIATLAVRWAALATFDIPTEFPPLAAPAPTIFFTVVGALGATAVFGVVRRYADRPEYLFRWIALGVLLLSFLADLVASGRRSCWRLPRGNPYGGRSAHADACRRCGSHRLVPDCERPDRANRTGRSVSWLVGSPFAGRHGEPQPVLGRR